MNAKLVYPDGQVQELSDAELEQVQATLDRMARKKRLKAVLDEIRNDPDKPSKEWWDEFEAELRANKLNFSERDLGLDKLPND